MPDRRAVTMFTTPDGVGQTASGQEAPQRVLPKRPSRWSLRNWPVRAKVFAIVAVPLALALAFGGARLYAGINSARDLQLAADRVEIIPSIENYMSAMEGALLAYSSGGDTQSAVNGFETAKAGLQNKLSDTDVAADVRTGVTNLLTDGQKLVGAVSSNAIGLSERITTYAPILLTAEDAINGSVRLDDEKLRAQAQGLSRAVGARGQMFMQELLVEQGGELPEPELRTTMITVAGTEPSTLFDMSQVLGVGSPDADVLQGEMVRRMGIMSNPDAVLVGNLDLRQSLQATDLIAGQVVKSITARLTDSVRQLATDRRNAVIRDALLTLAAFVIALVVVFLVARSLIRPLRTLRDGALKVAHTDLEQEIARVRAGDEREPEPLPVYTTEEVGQVAHAVDELHAQALLLAGDEARLRLLVNDMFETMSQAQPLTGRPAARADRPPGTQREGPGASGEPVPARPPGHPDAPHRRQPAGARRRTDIPRLSPVAAVGQCDQRRGVRGRGLQAGGDRRRAGLRSHRQGVRRCGPPAGRADRQRAAVLAAHLAGAGDRGAHQQCRCCSSKSTTTASA